MRKGPGDEVGYAGLGVTFTSSSTLTLSMKVNGGGDFFGSAFGHQHSPKIKRHINR